MASLISAMSLLVVSVFIFFSSHFKSCGGCFSSAPLGSSLLCAALQCYEIHSLLLLFSSAFFFIFRLAWLQGFPQFVDGGS